MTARSDRDAQSAARIREQADELLRDLGEIKAIREGPNGERIIEYFEDRQPPRTEAQPGDRLEIVPERRHELVEIAVFIWHILLLLALAAVGIAAGIGIIVAAALLLK